MTAVAQHLAALEVANRVRSENGETKKRIADMSRRDGFLAVAAILKSPDGPSGALPVGQLLNAIRRVSHGVSRPLLLRAGIYNHDRRVRELTPRQRSCLAVLLHEKAAL